MTRVFQRVGTIRSADRHGSGYLEFVNEIDSLAQERISFLKDEGKELFENFDLDSDSEIPSCYSYRS